jgi:hypothetical protein
LIEDAAREITDYEQNVVIVPTWQSISGMTTGPLLEAIFSILGKNSCTPSGKDFSELFRQPFMPPPSSDVITPGAPPLLPTGSLANTADRWHWIRPETQDGILDTWTSEGLTRKLLLTDSPMRSDGHRFSVLSAASVPTGTLVPIRCWDDDDNP